MIDSNQPDIILTFVLLEDALPIVSVDKSYQHWFNELIGVEAPTLLYRDIIYNSDSKI